jgi:hypothetical protein
MFMFFFNVTLGNRNLFPLQVTLAEFVDAIREIFVIERVFHELEESVDEFDL